MQLPALLRAMRPHQWSKNVFVLAAGVFAVGDERVGAALDSGVFSSMALAFAAFCLGSSTVYLLNDIVDVESDRKHPEKRHRPIASGELSLGLARLATAICALSALALATLATGGFAVTVVVGIYMSLNVAYSLRLKRVVLLDAFCIATGFLLRVQAGGLAAQVEISHWLLLCTFFLALFLAFNKRRAEIQLLGDERGSHRATLDEYSLPLLDQLTTSLAACTIICYTMYTVDEETLAKFGADSHMVYSVPFVVFGIGRYTYLVTSGRGGGSPTKIFLGGDHLFLANLVLWAVVVGGVVLRGW